MNKLVLLVGMLAVLTICVIFGQAGAQQKPAESSLSLEHTLLSITPPPLPGYEDVGARKTYVGERTLTYDVASRGVITANIDEFKRQAAETLADERGWARMGLTFKQVPANGDFTLVLAASDMMTSFSALGCHPDWSCNVGRNVIVNQDRWLGATTPWNAAGGTLRDYRHMVVNHEVGHNLGREHEDCSSAGNLAAVMQQQSYDLQGCRFNPWPLPSEVTRKAE